MITRSEVGDEKAVGVSGMVVFFDDDGVPFKSKVTLVGWQEEGEKM
jgi:hypothetical protein